MKLHWIRVGLFYSCTSPLQVTRTIGSYGSRYIIKKPPNSLRLSLICNDMGLFELQFATERLRPFWSPAETSKNAGPLMNSEGPTGGAQKPTVGLWVCKRWGVQGFRV